MSGIPKVFHQIWLGGREIPRQFLEYQETWRRHHRGWGLELWNEARLPELRLSKFLPLCNSLANRSNLLRVELLLLFGGVYLDTDFECMKSIEPLLEGVTCFAAYQLDDPLLEGAVNNAIIGAISGHPFLEDMVKGDSFLEGHLSAFRLDRWFRTIDGEEPRGIPYGDKGYLPVLLNHGLWSGIPDLDGPTSLVNARRPRSVIIRAAREVIPPGMYFPLCAMNVCYSRAAIPAAYNLLMGLDQVGFDRFDDIWSGLFLKRIADHLGLYITSGYPFVRHARASNPFINLRKEALGIQLHEEFWKHISLAPLGIANTVADCYLALSNWVAKFPTSYPSAPAPKGYFENLARAMQAWSRLFLPTC